MGIDYEYANLTKRERLSIGGLGGNTKASGLGFTLASRAFHLLLLGPPNNTSRNPKLKSDGRWAGDSIAIIGEPDWPNWLQFKVEFADLEANAIQLVFRADGFDSLGDSAARNDTLFMQLCHLVTTNQLPELRPHLEQRFGEQFLHRFKELCEEITWFAPKYIVT